MKKLRLEPTAALVMKWAWKLYNEGPARKYVNRLDLSSGDKLLKECNSVCDWYEEVILNRKSFIKYLIEQELRNTCEKFQLIFLASGKSPLPLEIVFENPARIHRVFEVDTSGMEDKKRLYLNLFPELADKLQCLTADITSPDIIKAIGQQRGGYRQDICSIVILEGISYYLNKQDLKNIITRFRSGKENIFIIEYMVPGTYIDHSRKTIPEEVFNIIQDYCRLTAINSYTGDELRKMFLEEGGDLTGCYSMVDMELNRTGSNAYFKKPGDGWIECASGRTGAIPE
ncbi:MAG: class I SAM-dependent methyltransferase [Dehalococcoidales bacterium]